VLLAVEVSQFERSNASEHFERTLEVVASLAVQSHQQGYAVGLVANGMVEGGPSLLPIGRSPQQVASILEILARLKMKAYGSLVDTLNRIPALPWGVSCLHFSYQRGEETLGAGQFLSHKRIPPIFVVCTCPHPGEGDRGTPEGTIVRLDEIRIEEPGRA
jgi:hypothetical protein